MALAELTVPANPFILGLSPAIREYVRHRQGVYALFHRGKLYCVGLASNLRTCLAHQRRLPPLADGYGVSAELRGMNREVKKQDGTLNTARIGPQNLLLPAAATCPND